MKSEKYKDIESLLTSIRGLMHGKQDSEVSGSNPKNTKPVEHENHTKSADRVLRNAINSAVAKEKAEPAVTSEVRFKKDLSSPSFVNSRDVTKANKAQPQGQRQGQPQPQPQPQAQPQNEILDCDSLWNVDSHQWTDADSIAFSRLMKKIIEPHVKSWINENMQNLAREEVNKHIKKMSKIRDEMIALK